MSIALHSMNTTLNSVRNSVMSKQKQDKPKLDVVDTIVLADNSEEFTYSKNNNEVNVAIQGDKYIIQEANDNNDVVSTTILNATSKEFESVHSEILISKTPEIETPNPTYNDPYFSLIFIVPAVLYISIKGFLAFKGKLPSQELYERGIIDPV